MPDRRLPAVLPAARGVEPTLAAPDPLDPALLADLARPPVAPAVADAVAAALLDAALLDVLGDPNAGPPHPEAAPEP